MQIKDFGTIPLLAALIGAIHRNGDLRASARAVRVIVHDPLQGNFADRIRRPREPSVRTWPAPSRRATREAATSVVLVAFFSANRAS